MNTFKQELFKDNNKIYYAKDDWLVSEDRDGNIEQISPISILRIKLNTLEYSLKNEHRS